MPLLDCCCRTHILLFLDSLSTGVLYAPTEMYQWGAPVVYSPEALEAEFRYFCIPMPEEKEEEEKAETQAEMIARVRAQFADRVAEKYAPYMKIATFILTNVIPWGIEITATKLLLDQQRIGPEADAYRLSVYDRDHYWEEPITQVTHFHEHSCMHEWAGYLGPEREDQHWDIHNPSNLPLLQQALNDWTRGLGREEGRPAVLCPSNSASVISSIWCLTYRTLISTRCAASPRLMLGTNFCIIASKPQWCASVSFCSRSYHQKTTSYRLMPRTNCITSCALSSRLWLFFPFPASIWIDSNRAG